VNKEELYYEDTRILVVNDLISFPFPLEEWGCLGGADVSARVAGQVRLRSVVFQFWVHFFVVQCLCAFCSVQSELRLDWREDRVLLG
jgi:hypothetical protein